MTLAPDRSRKLDGRLSNHHFQNLWSRVTVKAGHPRPPPSPLIPIFPRKALLVHTKMAQPNGTAEAPIEVSSISTVVGINFGNSYASIAVLTKVRPVAITLGVDA